LLGMIGGLLMSLGMFVSGVAVAAYFLSTEPTPSVTASVDVSDLWTGVPRTVNTSVQPFERLPALHQASAPEPSAEPPVQTGEAMAAELTAASADPIAIGATPAGSEQIAAGQDDGLSSAAHAQWCADRYRSWRPEDNSYTSFSGRQRPCVSPYSRGQEAAAEPVSSAPSEAENYVEFEDEQPLLQYASGEQAAYAGSDHVSYCFDRYRSYRPEDNSYQPYGGGPRRQCR
jgi:hypothetical protein